MTRREPRSTSFNVGGLTAMMMAVTCFAGNMAVDLLDSEPIFSVGAGILPGARCPVPGQRRSSAGQSQQGIASTHSHTDER